MQGLVLSSNEIFFPVLFFHLIYIIAGITDHHIIHIGVQLEELPCSQCEASVSLMQEEKQYTPPSCDILSSCLH